MAFGNLLKRLKTQVKEVSDVAKTSYFDRLIPLPPGVQIKDPSKPGSLESLANNLLNDYKKNPSSYTDLLNLTNKKYPDTTGTKYKDSNGVWKYNKVKTGGMTLPADVAIGADMLNVAQYLLQATSVKNELEKTAKSTWGGDFATKPEFKDWMERTLENSKGASGVETALNIAAGEGKDWKSLPLQKIPMIGKADNFVKDVVKTVTDVGSVAADFATGLVTGVVEAPVAALEAVDDIVEGKNVLDTVVDFTAKSTGADALIDAAEMIQEGDIAGAYLKGQSFVADQAGRAEGDVGYNVAETYADTLEKASDPSKDNILSDLRNTVNETVMGPEIEMPTDTGTKEMKMPTIDKTSLSELKSLLGIAPDAADKDVISALIGDEARKMADDPNIARMMELQGKVAETGYDVGEREALSSRARRELAGMARQQGMAAGAAAGGMRGASVGSQARSLMGAAMQKQADVTTEMDKASIARKDAARQQLAQQAKDVTRFDIEQEQERKKRKGATTIGVQSLLSQEEMGKQQLELAKQI